MKLGLFALCVLFSGASASFLSSLGDTFKHIGDEIKQEATQVGHVAEQGLHNALELITPENVQTVAGAVLPVLVQAGAAAVGKRDNAELKNVIDSAANTVGQVLHSYVDKLNKYHSDIKSLAFLKGDVQKFISDIENTRLSHNAALDSIVHNVKLYLDSLRPKRQQPSDFLGSLGQSFSSIVDHLKQTVDGVAGTLSSGAGGLLGNIQDHIHQFLSNSAGTLASGQEALQNLQTQASSLFHQAQAGVHGQAAQALDTLLHPASSS